MKSKLLCLGAIAAAFVISSGQADADETLFATTFASQPSAPVAITRCSTKLYYGVQASVNALNRTTHAMLDYSIEFRFYDRDNAQIGKQTNQYSLKEPVEPNDTASNNNENVGVNLAEPFGAISRVTCRAVAAHFTGQLTWVATGVWRGGKLAPVSSVSSNAASDTTSGASSDAPTGARARVWTFDVAEAWTDATTSGIYVNDSIVLHGGDADATVRPDSFRLRLNLSNGSKKAYAALLSAAPTYAKYNALAGQNVAAYQVDPQADFGKIGAVILPARGTVKVTLTFLVVDTPQSVTAIKDVTAN